ncbi:hypothetical protein U0035_01915 [Niabella yanshanensis]|uniref:DUF3298 domain-containing protein n=1 Tax=Niabella yanshanensis TaxID=577386 RepID=A0ABZ0W8A1_9BACT|nr:hypothetical protein [Niabella yanshanensis]WQD38899.1 hypothetical protein U0035_01915 [Niabella yanshanensis]
MIRKLMILSAVLFYGSVAFSQEVKNDVDGTKTKMDAFVSKTGTITKFVDTKLPNLRTSLGGFATTRIRKLTSGSTSAYFYQIVKGGSYGSNTASIEYSDLGEIINALKLLKSEVDKDIASKPDYLENKFITVDGFQIGYYISNEKPTWYIKLESYGSDNTIYLKSGDDIEVPFIEAKAKIEELKKE